MNTRWSLVVLALFALGLFIVGCAQQPYDPPTPIPTLAPATLPAVTPTEPAAAEGAAPTAVEPTAEGVQLFEQNCSVCHSLTSETIVGPGLAGLFDRDSLPNGNPVNDENLQEWIRVGGGAMPGFRLPDDQLAALIAFLKEATKE
jgi:mono/diheme cytochrome c family protein